MQQSITQCLWRRNHITKTELIDSLPCIENVNSIMNAMEQGSAHDKLAYMQPLHITGFLCPAIPLHYRGGWVLPSGILLY
ncbi:hypothetical protein [Komagataeibacter xylinus]|uniref:hypothetical protein n=1 Tax=Komagataeibacter xylinus TaxID=28448 RepID=UPI0010310ABC|nr:hypothetical protein [Komagataeibacter xylinus]